VPREIALVIANELRVAISKATVEQSRHALRQGLDAMLAAIAHADRRVPPAFRSGTAT
jgi:hypothetical protein